MTDQEFRDALKKSVGHTGLSSDRQMKVLARMKGDDNKVRTWYKMKVSLVLAVVLVLGATGAIAGSMGAVDWFGEETAPFNGWSLGSTEREARLIELHNASTDDVLSVVNAPNQVLGEIGGMADSTNSYYATTLSEMQAWVEADGTLSWARNIPEGYELTLGRVGYACREGGSFELIESFTTEDGYQVGRFRMPEEYRFMYDYFIRMTNEAGEIMTIRVAMHHGDGSQVFNVEEGGKVDMLDVPGMDNALFITSNGVRLAMRNQFDKEIAYISPHMNSDGKPVTARSSLGGVTMEITATDASLTADDLLAIFGLTAE